MEINDCVLRCMDVTNRPTFNEANKAMSLQAMIMSCLSVDINPFSVPLVLVWEWILNQPLWTALIIFFFYHDKKKVSPLCSNTAHTCPDFTISTSWWQLASRTSFKTKKRMMSYYTQTDKAVIMENTLLFKPNMRRCVMQQHKQKRCFQNKGLNSPWKSSFKVFPQKIPPGNNQSHPYYYCQHIELETLN